MTPHEANALLTQARAQDHLIPDSDHAAHTWADALGPRRRADGTTDPGVPFEAGQLIVRDFYGKVRDPFKKESITPAYIRKTYSTKARELESRHRALEPPQPKRGGGPPPEVRAKIDALFERTGHKRKHPTN